jgi:hypothetical protein
MFNVLVLILCINITLSINDECYNIDFLCKVIAKKPSLKEYIPEIVKEHKFEKYLLSHHDANCQDSDKTHMFEKTNYIYLNTDKFDPIIRTTSELEAGKYEETYIVDNVTDEIRKQRLIQLDRKKIRLLNNKHSETDKRLFKKWKFNCYSYFIYSTNRMEGNSCHYYQIRMYLKSDYKPHCTDKDILKITNTANAMKYLQNVELPKHARDKRLIYTEELILTLYKILYLSENNEGITFEDYNLIIDLTLLKQMITWLNSEEFSNLHPIEQAGLIHFVIVRVQLFKSGNGQIARILMNFIFLLNDYPIIFIHNQWRFNYTKVINDSHFEEVDISKFIAFLLYQMEYSFQQLEKYIYF